MTAIRSEQGGTMPDGNHPVAVSSPRLYYGWFIVGVAFFANFMAVGSGFYVFNAFLEPLCRAHNWTRTQVNIAPMLGTPIGLLGQFFIGSLVMRIGVRRLMVVGSLVSGTAFLLLFRVSSLWLFYLLYIMMYLGNGAYGGIVANSAVSNWFVGRRGKALGIATSGMSLSGAVLPLAAMFMIADHGMITTATFIGIMIYTVAPLCWLVVVDWPEDKGLCPDGVGSTCLEKNGDNLGIAVGITSPCPPMPMDRDPGNGHQRWDFHSMVRTPAFWKVGISYGMTMIGVVGVMSQLKPRFVDVGFSDIHAMLLMAVTSLLGAAGKYIWGTLCDMFESQKVAAALILANGIGLAAALFAHSAAALVVFVCLFGFAMGGVMSTYPIIVADLFGRDSFAAVYRFMMIFLALQMAGFIIAGLSFDLAGSYTPAYVLFIIIDLAAALLVMTVRRPA